MSVSLRHLDLRSCRISHSAFNLDASSHQQNLGLPHLRLLDLTGVKRFQDEGLSFIASLVIGGALKVLRLSRSLISDGGLVTAFDSRYLTAFSSIEVLDLDSCRVGDRGVAAVLRSCPMLQQLNLSETLVGDSTLALIRQLSLPPTDLSSRQKLQQGKHSMSLSHLELSWSKVTNAGLAMTLSSLTSLRHLNLDSGSLNDNALLSLPSSLTALLCFSLRCHDTPGASLIATCLPHLQQLELCGGCLGDDGLRELRKLTLLRWLNLSQNPAISDKGVVS